MPQRRWAAYLARILALSVAVIIGYSLYTNDEPIVSMGGNTQRRPILFPLEHTVDPVSKMLIRRYDDACEAILSSGETYFFAEPADMVLWLRERQLLRPPVLWVYTRDTGRWIPARKAWYGVRDATPMGYGFGVREHRCARCLPYREMRRRVLQGESLLNPRIRKRLLEDNYPGG